MTINDNSEAPTALSGLNGRGNGNGQDMRIALVFKVFDEIDSIETAIA